VVNSVDSVAESAVIVGHFMSHFSKSCSSNNATAASQFKRTYDMRMDHCSS